MGWLDYIKEKVTDPINYVPNPLFGVLGTAKAIQKAIPDRGNGGKGKGKSSKKTTPKKSAPKISGYDKLINQVMKQAGVDKNEAKSVIDLWHAQYGYPQHSATQSIRDNVPQLFDVFLSKYLTDKNKKKTGLGIGGIGGFGGGDPMASQMLFNNMLKPYLEQSYNDYNSQIAANDNSLNQVVSNVNLPPGFKELFTANRARESAAQRNLNAAMKQNTLVAPMWEEMFRQINEARSRQQDNYWSLMNAQRENRGTVSDDPVLQMMAQLREGTGSGGLGAEALAGAFDPEQL